MPRYYYPNARNTTEKTKSISIFWLKKEGYLNGVKNEGFLSWRRRDVVSDPICFLIDIKENKNESCIHIQSPGNNFLHTYRLLPFPCFLGGHRWFFECRTTRNDDNCGKRVCILYENNGKFVCRDCANLSYQSCNEPKLYRQDPFRIITRANKACEIKSKTRKETYKGKLTRKYRRINKIMGSITEEDLREAESRLFKI